jgi:hypothetical protein
MVWWTHDSGDTKRGELPAPGCVIDRVMHDGGGVVLMHDFDREGEPAHVAARAEYVLEVTEGLLVGARRNGMSVRTVSELIGRTRVA